MQLTLCSFSNQSNILGKKRFLTSISLSLQNWIFVRLKHFRASMSTSKTVGGVAMVPIHRFSKTGHPLDGKICVVLAREVGGAYADKLNFIGGSAKDHEGDAWKTLSHESEEELGLPMSRDLFARSCIGATLGGKRNGTLLVAAHITGLSARRWKAMKAKRQGLEYKFNELKGIVHVPIEELTEKNGHLSGFVRDFIGDVQRWAKNLTSENAVHYTEFKSVPRTYKHVPMLD